MKKHAEQLTPEQLQILLDEAAAPRPVDPESYDREVRIEPGLWDVFVPDKDLGTVMLRLYRNGNGRVGAVHDRVYYYWEMGYGHEEQTDTA